MRWIRAFPEPMPPRKSHIIDGMERFYHTDYDYSNLVKYEDDILLIEWDLAADRLMRRRFEQTVEVWHEEEPLRIIVAPYLLHEAREQSVWAHRHVTPEGKETWIQPRDTEADYFGFGMIYLPLELMRAFLAAPKETRGTPIGIEPENYTDYRFCDQTFSVWHYRQGLDPAYVTWEVIPIHLNEGKWQ